MCGNGTRPDGFIDFQIYYDYEGYVYLCMMCFEETLDTLGYLTKDEVNLLKTQSNDLATENERLKSQLGEANERLAHYDAIIGSAFTGVPSISVLAEQGEAAAVLKDGVAPVGIANEPADRESDVTEPVKISRSNDSSRTKRGNTSIRPSSSAGGLAI